MSYARVFWLLYLQRKSDLKEVQLTIKARLQFLFQSVSKMYLKITNLFCDLEVRTNYTIAQKRAKIKVSVLAKNVF